jgi:3-keto-disaccharide hydrolase
MASGEGAAGLRPIFNGKDLTGWRESEPNPFWHVRRGVLIGENDPAKRGDVLYTRKVYEDFVLDFEVRWSGEIDSGIMLRKPELQLQLGVSRSLKRDMSCSFYTGGKDIYPQTGRAEDLEKYFKPGHWNRIRLRAEGDTFTVWLNGKEVVSHYTNPKYSMPAPIGLQIHPGLRMKVEYRRLRLKELK